MRRWTVLITGAGGFVGKNLRLVLAEREDIAVLTYGRGDDPLQLIKLVGKSDVVIHLAGVNRPEDPAEFEAGNAQLTRHLCDALATVANDAGRRPLVVYASSIQAERENPYGMSKRSAEEALHALSEEVGVPVRIFRLPNVFGKWCRPNYNSAVATFCHNIARDLPIQIHDRSAPLTLVHIDDLIARLIALIDTGNKPGTAPEYERVSPEYQSTVGEVADLISAFRRSRDTLLTERVGTGLTRALYATYVSYLPVEAFAYDVAEHRDHRGIFVEMLKTPDSGQFSFFSAGPGVTRGGHYHHSKTEKFLVIRGQARFKFRQMDTNETYELTISGDKARIVETVPGWTHDITNIGADELLVMLWANEVFDRARPDTFACPL